jgi:hypothetical protein
VGEEFFFGGVIGNQDDADCVFGLGYQQCVDSLICHTIILSISAGTLPRSDLDFSCYLSGYYRFVHLRNLLQQLVVSASEANTWLSPNLFANFIQMS